MTVNNDTAESTGSTEQGSGATGNENFRQNPEKVESFREKEENSEPDKSFKWSPGATPGGELICDLCPDFDQVKTIQTSNLTYESNIFDQITSCLF